jgi:hypothetical protein
MTQRPLDFRTPDPEPINWPARIAAHLDTLGPITKADLTLIEAAARGRIPHMKHDSTQRLLDLLRGARDANYRVTMDGQAALLAAVRGRV